jgi:hypothetical protein
LADRFFLDTNQWNYLCDPTAPSASASADLPRRFLDAVRTRQLAVVSSVAVLEELMGTAHSQPAKYSEMCDVIFRAVGQRWLLPLDQRASREAFCGGLLPDTQRYLPRSTRRRMQEEALRQEAVELIGNEVYMQVSTFKNDQEAIRTKLRHDVGREGAARFRETINHWWDHEADVRSWVSDLITSAIEHGRAPGGARSDRDGAPSTWCFVSYKLARIKLNLADNRSIKKSDYLDADHYSCGPYYDVLVTDDGAFKDTCGLLPDTPFAIETFDQFIRRFA